ncbi:MAG: phage-related tail protein [Methylophilaceae bacterium]|jgi:phage-related tail protein
MKKFWLELSFLFVVPVFVAPVQAETNQEKLEDADVIQVALNDVPTKKWVELTEEQQVVLSPLATEWDTLRPWQREKMLDIAKDYPKVNAKKQKRVKDRLNSWSRMTPYERENARKRFQHFHSLSPEKKQELRNKWAEYQKLPEAEREKRRKESDEVYYDPELE